MQKPEIMAIAVNRKIHGYSYVERAKRGWEVVAKKLAEIVERGQPIGYVVLDTCSRQEIYIAAPGDRIYSYAHEVGEALARASSADPRIYAGLELVEHILRVLSGSESPAPFERDILDQVRKALDRAPQTAYGAKMLYNIFREASELSIGIRRDLGVDGGTGIPELSVLAAKHLLGNLEGMRVAVIGTGEVGGRIARYLSTYGVSDSTIVGRSLARAEAIAKLFPRGKAYTMDRIGDAIAGRDLIFLAVSSSTPILGGKAIHDIPGYVIDVAIPRNTDPEAIEALGHRYIWMEDLEEISQKILPNLYKALEDFERVLKIYIERLYTRYIIEKLREDLGGFARLYESIRRGEIERAVTRLHLGDRERELLDLVTSSIMKKALGVLGDLLGESSPRGGDRGG
ncbi:MAG: NAD(P)-binding domain-containing protein [Sulfolobales archaeon]